MAKRTPRRNWWVFVEKDLEKPGAKHELYGPFTHNEAQWAFESDPIIDASCIENCLDAGLVRADHISQDEWGSYEVSIAVNGWSKFWPKDPGLMRVNAPSIEPYVTIPRKAQ